MDCKKKGLVMPRADVNLYRAPVLFIITILRADSLFSPSAEFEHVEVHKEQGRGR